MAAKYLLAGIGGLFLILAARRLAQEGNLRHPQTRAWLLIAAIFAGVSAWLFYTT